ncbi:MAG: aldehyde dehydrogenase family protein [Arachnia sp.]
MNSDMPVDQSKKTDIACNTDLTWVNARVDDARGAFASGRTKPLAWRRQQLKALERMLTESASRLREALWADLRKNQVESQLTEIFSVIGEIRHALKNLDRWSADRKVRATALVGPARAAIHREPLGTVLIIGPWNYPINLIFSPLVGALAAGNTVVLKPSEVAPACSALVAELVPKFLDADAIVVVEGGVEETTALLKCRFDHIFYTGNGAVGSVVMVAAAKNLTPVTLELGGKSPVWVDSSAALESAARAIAWGKFSNCGQTCVAPDYVLTTPELVEPLAREIARVTRQMYNSDPAKSRNYGRIVNEKHTARLAGLLESGRAYMGGGADVAERYIAPTILLDVDPDSPIMQDEIFGPILPIIAVDDLDGAIDFINARPKPLALYAFSEDETVRVQIQDRTSSGGLGFNLVLAQLVVTALPFGGVGGSGMGRYHGEFGMKTFSHEKAVLRKLRGPDPFALARPPYSWVTRKLFMRG